jgi:hypothetical protein
VKTQELVEEVVRLLNRPTEDSLFDYPNEHHDALNRAIRKARRLVAQHFPNLLYESTTLTSSDGGNTFTLSDDHLGEIQLWRSPGPPKGILLMRTDAWGGGDYWIEGRDIKFTVPMTVEPLYVSWIPASHTNVNKGNDPTLPDYFRDWIANQAAAYMARKPGYLGDYSAFEARALNEWGGDRRDPSDLGILGTLKRQDVTNPYRTTTEGIHPWYHGMGRDIG